jgi:hypothetical protein
MTATKSRAVVRKTFGHGHIAQRFYRPINGFFADDLTRFLNLHRPCLCATEIDKPAKQVGGYRAGAWRRAAATSAAQG